MWINNQKILRLMFYYFKILGFFPYVYDRSEVIKKSKKTIIYTIILMLGYSVNFVNILISRSSFVRPQETIFSATVDFAILGLEYISILIIWIYSITRCSQLQCIVKLFIKSIEYTSVTMKIELANIYDDILRQMWMVILFFNVLFLTVMSADHVLFYLENKDYDNVTWIVFNYPRVIAFNYVMVYIYFLKILKRQFYFMNKNISYLPEVYTDKNSFSIEVITIREFNQLYLDLKDLIIMSDELLALPILTALLLQFLNIILYIYLLLIFILSKNYYWSGLITIGWILMRISQLFFSVDTCNSICYEANRKAKILHELWALKRPDGFKEMLKSISLHQLQEPVEIKLYDALNMNHELLYKMVGIITTYLIIMIQLDQQVQDKEKHKTH
ncbi:GSCOCT00014062001.2-RA-CDS [Cotesia congregata]|uniref:Gustatory receptor n=1 Tax=Cotesia congregata TaxID=51543 RepID=A0A8J2HL92_COTCN|nr:GSCOCT00014062001.2-RA-CDS [Cotesia congregata]CAG5096025.1 gustatory receptor 5 [Cotesia congregata]